MFHLIFLLIQIYSIKNTKSYYPPIYSYGMIGGLLNDIDFEKYFVVVDL